MKHIQTSQTINHLKIAILIKESSLNQENVLKHYIDPLVKLGIDKESIITFSLDYFNNKVTATQCKEYLTKLLPALKSLGITTLLVASSEYFKQLCKLTKVESSYGYVLPCMIKGYEEFNCILSINYQALFYDNKLQNKIDLSLNTLSNHILGLKNDIGKNVIHLAQYPDTYEEIALALESLHKYPELTVDIEAFSLNFWDAGIGTIAFNWDKHNGIAFCVDYCEYATPQIHDNKAYYGSFLDNFKIKGLLKEFFETYKGKLIGHGLCYDLKILIYELFMKNKLDKVGLTYGLDVLTRDIDDTMLIAYLATNSCAGNVLGLKPLAHEFTGSYAQEDINDIRLIPKQQLLEYNLYDTCATWYIKEKYEPVMIKDDQLSVYETIFKPSIRIVIGVEICGLPIDIEQVKVTEKELTHTKNTMLKEIESNPLIVYVENELIELAWKKDYEDRLSKSKTGKIKTKDVIEFHKLKFNPGSGKHLQHLLYNYLGLEVTDYTDTKQPATGTKILKKKMNQLIAEFDIKPEELTLTEFIPELFEEEEI